MSASTSPSHPPRPAATPRPPTASIPDRPVVRPPNRHKLVLLNWIGIYPTITVVLWFLLPVLLPRFPLPVVTLIITGIVVPLMSYVVMPVMVKVFGEWTRR